MSEQPQFRTSTSNRSRTTDPAVAALLRKPGQPGRGGTDATTAIDPQYAELRDRRLAATLAAEDVAEENGFNPLERLTCRTHLRWVHQCLHSPDHVIVVTGHRWCRACRTAANVTIDELTGDVTVTCPACGHSPQGPATRQIVRTCRASLAAAVEHR